MFSALSAGAKTYFACMSCRQLTISRFVRTGCGGCLILSCNFLILSLTLDFISLIQSCNTEISNLSFEEYQGHQIIRQCILTKKQLCVQGQILLWCLQCPLFLPGWKFGLISYEVFTNIFWTQYEHPVLESTWYFHVNSICKYKHLSTLYQ